MTRRTTRDMVCPRTRRATCHTVHRVAQLIVWRPSCVRHHPTHAATCHTHRHNAPTRDSRCNHHTSTRRTAHHKRLLTRVRSDTARRITLHAHPPQLHMTHLCWPNLASPVLRHQLHGIPPASAPYPFSNSPGWFFRHFASPAHQAQAYAACGPPKATLRTGSAAPAKLKFEANACARAS